MRRPHVHFVADRAFDKTPCPGSRSPRCRRHLLEFLLRLCRAAAAPFFPFAHPSSGSRRPSERPLRLLIHRRLNILNVFASVLCSAFSFFSVGLFVPRTCRLNSLYRRQGLRRRRIWLLSHARFQVDAHSGAARQHHGHQSAMRRRGTVHFPESPWSRSARGKPHDLGFGRKPRLDAGREKPWRNVQSGCPDV